MPTIPTISRRRFLGTTAGAGLTVARLAGQAPQVASPSEGAAPDLMLVNGRIQTMDARSTVASMVTIRNGRFSAVGRAVLRKNSIRAKCDEIRRARTSGSTPNVELDRDKSHRKVLDC